MKIRHYLFSKSLLVVFANRQTSDSDTELNDEK